MDFKISVEKFLLKNFVDSEKVSTFATAKAKEYPRN